LTSMASALIQQDVRMRMSVVSLILAVLSVAVTFVFPTATALLGSAAIWSGVTGLRREGARTYAGSVAITGIVVGALALGLLVGLVLFGSGTEAISGSGTSP